MEESKKICRLCLSCDDDSFTQLDASAIGKVKTIIPGLKLTFPSEFFVCSKCKDVLEKGFELKRTFSKNNELIQNEKDKSKSNQVDLKTIAKGEKAGSGENVCRICLKYVEGAYIPIDKEGSDDFANVLDHCIPELDESLTVKPVMCSPCQTLLYKIYNYKNDWLSVEERIQSCTSGENETIDLNKVLMLSKVDDENDFLSAFEVQDEEGTDIFDALPNPTEEISVPRKRTISEPAKEEPKPPVKKSKLETKPTPPAASDQLPDFKFSPNLLYNPTQTDVMVEDWLAQVEDQKRRLAWSDSTTIHKVLVKLKDMKELYIWFSNIADIMDWEQWKKKLVRAFPRKTDYHIHVKRMVTRKKKKEETYVSYYKDKVALMGSLDLTAEQKVSCIFGGITDVLVCCVGRVGDYQSPEELLDYFQSCDDKESVEAAAQVTTKGPKAPANPERQIKLKTPAHASLRNITEKCTDCFRHGHTIFECRQFKIGQHLTRMDQLTVQDNPMASQARARRPSKKGKPSNNCLTCGKVGHKSDVCFFNRKARIAKYKFSAAQPSPPKPLPQKKVYAPECYICHQVGHTMKNCPSTKWQKNLDKRKSNGSPNAKNNQEWGGNNGSGQLVWCQNCNKYGSTENPCCPASMPPNDAYLGAYSSGAHDYDRQICMRCYKTGHPTKDCEEFARKFHRK